jgi:hypothetical protein
MGPIWAVVYSFVDMLIQPEEPVAQTTTRTTTTTTTTTTQNHQWW